MALTVKMESTSVMRVDEILPGYMTTEHLTVRYDFVNMKKKVNDENWREMTQRDLDWVNKYYLPKLNENKGE